MSVFSPSPTTLSPRAIAPTIPASYGLALKQAAQLLTQGILDDLVKGNVFGTIERFFDQKLLPLLERIGYFAQNLIGQLKTAAQTTLEDLGDQVTGLANTLLSQANQQFQYLLSTIFDQINRARAEALADLRQTAGSINDLLAARINQVATIVMHLVKHVTDLLQDFNPEQLLEQLLRPIFEQVERLEAMILRDVAIALDQVDAIISGNLDDIRNDLARLVHFFPNPWDPARQVLKLGFTWGVTMTDVQLYRLYEARQLRLIAQHQRRDTDPAPVRDIYAQLQASAVVMRRIVRGAPQAEDLYLRDWLKYGQLYQHYA